MPSSLLLPLRSSRPPAPGSRIVDVACGPGTLSVLAAQAGHQLDALDFSRPMITKLTERMMALGVRAIKSHVGDGQALPFPDGTFDAGFSMFGLMFFPDRAKGFAELRRVLRLKRRELERVSAALPGVIRRGARVDLADSEAQLREAGVRCELRRRTV